MGRDDLTGPDRPQAFTCFRLESDLLSLNVQDPGDAAAHSQLVGRQFRLFRMDDTIDVHDLVAGREHPFIGCPEHIRRISSAIGLVRIRKQFPDVTRCDRAKERVGDGVQEHVRVTVPDEVPVAWHVDTTEPERSPIGQSVRVVANANPKSGRNSTSVPLSCQPCRARSTGTTRLPNLFRARDLTVSPASLSEDYNEAGTPGQRGRACAVAPKRFVG